MSKCLISSALAWSVCKTQCMLFICTHLYSHYKARAHAPWQTNLAHKKPRTRVHARMRTHTHMHMHAHAHARTFTRNAFIFDSLLCQIIPTQAHTKGVMLFQPSDVSFLFIGSKLARLIYIRDALWLPPPYAEHLRSNQPEVPKKEKLTEAHRRKDVRYIIPNNSETENILMRSHVGDDWIKTTFRY